MQEQTAICTYRVQSRHEDRFLELLARHWRTLHGLGLVTDERSEIYRSVDEPPTYVEIFTWREGGLEQARTHPDVLAIWDPMEPLLEERDGRPAREFPRYRRKPATRQPSS